LFIEHSYFQLNLIPYVYHSCSLRTLPLYQYQIYPSVFIYYKYPWVLPLIKHFIIKLDFSYCSIHIFISWMHNAISKHINTISMMYVISNVSHLSILQYGRIIILVFPMSCISAFALSYFPISY
jgi:hypothetical protein